MKYALVLFALAFVSLSAACGPDTAAPAGSDTNEERRVTVSPARAPSLVLGDEATTATNGTTLSIISYESGVAVKNATPERGFEFSSIEVKGCAGPDSENSLMHIGPDAFALRLPDGTSVFPEDRGGGARFARPELQSMNPLPGECGSGIVTFQIPRGERPELVLYDEQFVLKKTIAWRVPKAR